MRSYIDLTGQAVDRPPAIPPRWRIACYPIIRRDGMVLMVEPVWAGRWELPGGGVELDREETLVEAAARECLEETGYRVVIDPGSLEFEHESFFSVVRSGNYYHSLLFSVAGTVVAEPSVEWTPDSREIRRIGWIDPCETADPLHRIHQRVLARRMATWLDANP